MKVYVIRKLSVMNILDSWWLLWSKCYLKLQERDSIIERWKTRRADDLITMHNKSPVWNEGIVKWGCKFYAFLWYTLTTVISISVASCATSKTTTLSFLTLFAVTITAPSSGQLVDDFDIRFTFVEEGCWIDHILIVVCSVFLLPHALFQCTGIFKDP